MAIEPEGLQISVVFPRQDPFAESKFRGLAKSLKAEVEDGAAMLLTGDQVPILGFRHKMGNVVYARTTGIVTLNTPRAASVGQFESRVVHPLLRAAGIRIGQLKNAEFQAIYLIDSTSTALTAMRSALPPAPTWLEKAIGTEMQSWGLRFVPKTASTWKEPFRQLTPWYELSVEPFANNPRKTYVRFLVREQTWKSLKSRLRGLPSLVQRLSEKVLF